MPNALITPHDLGSFRVGGFESAKLMWYAKPSEVFALRELGCTHFLVRLPDSVTEDGRWKGDEEWANECIGLVNRFYALGITDFQLDCEPNLTWKPLNDPEVAQNWRWLTGQVYGMITEAVPPAVRLG